MEVVYELNLQNWNGERFRTLFSHEKWRIVARATSRLHVRSIEPLDLEISVIRARETSRFPLEEEVKKRKKNSIFDLHEIFLSERGIYRLEYLAPRFSLLLFNSSPVAMTLLPILPRPYSSFFSPSRSRRRARETEGSSCTRRRARTVTKGSAYSWGNLYVNVRRIWVACSDRLTALHGPLPLHQFRNLSSNFSPSLVRKSGEFFQVFESKKKKKRRRRRNIVLIIYRCIKVV